KKHHHQRLNPFQGHQLTPTKKSGPRCLPNLFPSPRPCSQRPSKTSLSPTSLPKPPRSKTRLPTCTGPTTRCEHLSPTAARQKRTSARSKAMCQKMRALSRLCTSELHC